MSRLTPQNAQFALVSFEGPDEYARSGGLAVRVRDLSAALAEAGFETHLFFVGDPNRPGEERQDALVLHRWCQWISSFHPGGVYDGEWGKVQDMAASLPPYLVDHVVRPGSARGRVTVLMCEDWQTVPTLLNTSHLLAQRDLTRSVIPVWTANNLYGFHSIDFSALQRSAAIMTVSKYMKHAMWPYGVNPLVVPNGVASSAIVQVPPGQSRLLRRAFGSGVALFKIGRFSPDKRWTMALDAVAVLRHLGTPARILIRGDKLPYGYEVLARARSQGLVVEDLTDRFDSVSALAKAMAAHHGAHVLNLRSFLPDELLPPIYAAVDGVLANSGHEPFGLVGLEVMGAGGLAFVGSTGEEYAEPMRNAIVVDTDDPREIAVQLRQLDEAMIRSMKRRGRETAKAYLWSEVLKELLAKLEFVALTRDVEVGT